MTHKGQTCAFPALETKVRSRNKQPFRADWGSHRVEAEAVKVLRSHWPRAKPRRVPKLGAEEVSNFGLLRNGQGIVYFDPKITDRAFKLSVAEEKLYCPQISRALVYQGGLGPA